MTRQTDAQIRRLLTRHARRILNASIAKPVARARGYRSVTTKAELRQLGFTDTQCRVPALVLPVWGVYGEIANYQLRADDPRIDRRGKPVKYELPRGSLMLLDAHPAIREQLGDPAIPLWITEGIFKADAAISVGLCCIALLGVWNWRGTNGLGGKTALPDWEAIALAGRQIYLAFDSDVMTKPQVYAALERLGAFLASRKAHVSYVYLPSGPGGTKVGLDDYLAAGHTVDDLLALASPELRRPPHDATDAEAPYAITDAGMIWRKPVEGGSVDVLMANFSALIREDVLVDDGVVAQRQLVLEATLRGQVLPIQIPATQFAGMSWVAERLGAGAIVEPGFSTKDRLRHAMQILSGAIPQRRVYAHTGWRRLDGAWGYLHAGGAIGPEGAVPGVDVTLSPPLARMVLPEPPDGEDLVVAVRAALRLLELLPLEVAVPLLGATWLAALLEPLGADAPDFVLWLHGPSGVFKSEYLALAMAFYGDFARTSLPANFSATANAVERFAFEAKDALLAVDDFHPAGDAREQAAMNQVVNRLLRGAGNRSGRSRMFADTTLRPTLVPRGLAVVSGERLPEGHSSVARMFPVAVERGRFTTTSQLTQAQEARHHYTQAMAGYLQFLAQRFDTLRDDLPVRFRALRQELQLAGSHRREPGQVAHLLLGLETFFAFAVELGAISEAEQQERMREGRAVLAEQAQEHAESQAEEAPEQVFLRLLAGGIAGKRAYLEDKRGGAPQDAARWGWEPSIRRDAEGGESVAWQHPAVAQLVGVIDEPWLLLFPEPVYQFVAGAARQGGRVFPVEAKTLWRRLDEAGLLAAEQEGSKRRRVANAWLGGASRRVLKLRADAVAPPPPSESGEEGEGGEGSTQERGNAGEGSSHYGGNGAERGKDSGAETDGREPSLPPIPPLPTPAGEEGQTELDLAEVVEWSG
jgi:hypothetical protein